LTEDSADAKDKIMKVSAIKSQRLFKNFFLQPKLQFRFGLYSTVIYGILYGVLGTYFYYKLQEFTDVIVTLTEADQEVYDMLNNYLLTVARGGIIAAAIFLVLSLALSVYFTHKMVGPTVAFRRHISSMRNGEFHSRIALRQGDAFWEVAEDLNRLAADWQGKTNSAVQGVDQPS
jgi:methyl-accepting chemotaxis protein